MPANVFTDLEKLVASQKTGFTLDQPFYTAPDVFAADFEAVVRRQWLLVGHVSEVAEAGAYRTVQVAQESVILVRTQEGEIRAFYNVCRHRGSRICANEGGATRLLRCPYHAWAYDLDGRLISAQNMPEGFDPSDFGLIPCPVRLVYGLIFIHLGDGDETEFEQVLEGVDRFLKPHALETCKVAFQKSYPTDANWKLVLENFLECYHCKPSHPEYSSINAHVKLSGDGSPAACAEFNSLTEEWEKKAVALGHPTGHAMTDIEGGGLFFGAYRHPINDGFESLTKDGTRAAPLLEGFNDYDGGETIVSFGPLAAISGANDYVTLFSFLPISERLTDVRLTWLVREDAEAGRDYDVDKVVWMWDVTTEQDKSITNFNQAGVNSAAYRPGPYSTLEADTHTFTRWYLNQLSTYLSES